MTVLDYRSGADEQLTRSRGGHWLGWAIYLGMSWTWCIGMFLPVLLVRDYGIWGFVVFAVPNVIGAAAMGWVLRDASSSERFVARHAHACSAFSVVTIAFHVFFVVWFSRLFDGFAPAALIATLLIYIATAARSWRVQVAAACALTLSLSAAVYYFLEQRSYWASGLIKSFDPSLISLGTVCIFGFLLCPYLDLTFHRARQATAPSTGRLAFGVGFGVVFLSMILFTLLYSNDLYVSRFVTRVSHAVPRGLSLSNVVALHMLLQCGFTLTVHAQALVDRVRKGQRGVLAWNAVGVFAALLLGYLSWKPWLFRFEGISTGEIIYRCFLAVYGLIVPAYLWLNWRNPSRRSLVVFAIAVLLASPFYWLGFIEQKMFWLLPGLGIVLLARLAVPRNAVAA